MIEITVAVLLLFLFIMVIVACSRVPYDDYLRDVSTLQHTIEEKDKTLRAQEALIRELENHDS